MIAAAIFVIFPLCLALAALTDLFTMMIPNRVPAILMASFLLVAPLAGMSVADIGMHLVAGGAVFAVCFTFFAMNVMGGGDAKLLTAAAVWFGFNPSLMEFMVYVAYVGGIVTLAIMLMRAQSDWILAMGLSLPHSLMEAKKIPYGIAIGIGGFLAYPASPLVALALGRL